MADEHGLGGRRVRRSVFDKRLFKPKLRVDLVGESIRLVGLTFWGLEPANTGNVEVDPGCNPILPSRSDRRFAMTSSA